MRHVSIAAMVIGGCLLSGHVSAEGYPSRRITLVVPAAAGGPTDTIARILAERMRTALGETVIIENNGAAGGSIAVGKAARSAADGYTVNNDQTITFHTNFSTFPNMDDKDGKREVKLNGDELQLINKSAPSGGASYRR